MPRRNTLNLPDLPLRRPLLTVMVVLLLTAVALVGMRRLKEEEDILTFLPGSDPSVAVFRDMARRFGAMRVGLIGVEPPAGESLFSPAMLGRIERLSGALKNTEGVDRVVSLSTMTDLVVSDEMTDPVPLVPSPPPTDPEQLAKLRRRALSLPHVAGNVVSADGQAGLLMVFLIEGASTRKVVDRARDLALSIMASGTASGTQPGKVYFGGAPFAGQAIYADTQVDTRRLTPIALLFFLVIVQVAFKDWLAVLLTVGTVGIAGIWVLGGMGWAGEPFTVVTAMLPVILFAAGSQYAIHVLARYYILRAGLPAPGAARGAMGIAGPPVTVAASATCLGFLSFLVMNIRPMRSFGLACAFGIVVAWLLAMTLVPAVVAAWPRPPEQEPDGTRMGRALEVLWGWVQRRRVLVLIGFMALVAVVARHATHVQVRMEPRAFFRPGSEPAQAQQFLDERFGGSQFVQIIVHGDPVDPAALREIQRLVTFAKGLPGVSQVQSILDPLLLVSEAIGGTKNLPGDRQQVGNLLFFIEGEPSVRTLLTSDRQDALVHVRFRGDSAPIIAALEGYLGTAAPAALRGGRPAPPGGPALAYKLSGEPMLDKGFSRAVEQNQWASLKVAMLSVFLVLLFSLRSLQGAILCLLPAGLSLGVIFAGLAWLHQPIDIGTSLVGSIVTGSGADFAMHYIWYLRRRPAREVVRVIGPVILTTAVLLGAGLGVLALGNSPPLRLFGVLAAAGLVLSALFTFLLVPALLRTVRSQDRSDFV